MLSLVRWKPSRQIKLMLRELQRARWGEAVLLCVGQRFQQVSIYKLAWDVFHKLQVLIGVFKL